MHFNNINNSGILFFLNLYIFFKKSNATLKKINNFNKNTNLINQKFNFFNENYFLLTKYFFFFQQTNNLTNSIKLVDLKKKFILNLYDFKSQFNFILLKKKTKFNTSFKNYKKLFLYFSKFNVFFYEYNILKVLLKTKFIFNYSDFFFFSKKKNIFLNRKFLNLNNVTIFKQNDVLEIIFNKLYINYLEKIYYIYNKNIVKKKIKIKINASNIYLYDFFNKIKNFEVSFKSSSIILFYDKFNLINASNYYSLFFNYYYIHLYKWKY